MSLQNLNHPRPAEHQFRHGKDRFRRITTMPIDPPWARLVIFHGYGEHAGRYGHFTSWLAQRGIVCHAFDSRGHGLASGRRGYVRNWGDFLRDAQAALSEEERLSPTGVPRFLLGHSHGGLVVALGTVRKCFAPPGIILSAPYFQNAVPVGRGRLIIARAVATLAPWKTFATRLSETWLSSDEAMLAESRADPLILHRATPAWYLKMLEAQREALRRAGELKTPLLCLVGARDPVATPAATTEFFNSAGSVDKQIKIYPGMLHEILRETGREAVFEEILRWMRQRVRR